MIAAMGTGVRIATASGLAMAGADGRVPSLRNDKEDEWKQSK